MKKLWKFSEELNRGAYVKLIDYLFQNSDRFSFKIYPEYREWNYSQKAVNLYNELEDYLIDVNEVKAGTFTSLSLWDWKICYFKTNDKTKEILNKYNGEGFFSWTYPSLLDDLCFYKGKKRLWVESVSHEGMLLINEENDEIIKEIENITDLKLEVIWPMDEETIIEVDETEECKAKQDFINDENSYMCEYDIDTVDFEKVSFQDIENFERFIEKNNIEWYYNNPSHICIYEENLKELYSNISEQLTEKVRGKNFRAVSCIYLNDKYIEKIELIEGSFSGTYDLAVPVVLGLKFKKIFKLKDMIPFSYLDEKGYKHIKYLEVCGFAASNNYGIDSISEMFVSLDKFIIIPSKFMEAISSFDFNEGVEVFKKSDLIDDYTRGYFHFKDKEERVKLEKYLRDLGLNYKFFQLREKIKI